MYDVYSFLINLPLENLRLPYAKLEKYHISIFMWSLLLDVIMSFKLNEGVMGCPHIFLNSNWNVNCTVCD